MDNLDLSVLRTAAGWRAEQRGVVLGTITRTWGSAPRPVGSLVAVRDDGQIAGSVSGGCIEDDLVAQLRAGSLTLDRPAPLRYGVGAEEARRPGAVRELRGGAARPEGGEARREQRAHLRRAS